MSAQKDKSLPQKNEDETRTADEAEWEAEKTAEARDEVSVSPSHFKVDLSICVLMNFVYKYDLV